MPNDEITPALRRLQQQISPDGRNRLLRKMITDIEQTTKANFGEVGRARPYTWKLLSDKYAKRVKRPFATLVLTTGNFVKGLFGTLRKSFLKTAGTNEASLTNLSPYADAQMFGNEDGNLPPRQVYPIESDGSLTEFQQARLAAIAEKHFGGDTI